MTGTYSAPGGEAQAAFLGLRFDTLSLDQALDQVGSLARGEAFTYVVTPNVDHMVRLHRDGSDRAAPDWQAYRQAALRLCDSRILAMLAGWSGLELPVAAGSDLTARLLSSPAISGWRVALIGGDADQLNWLERERPDCRWLHHMPPMGVRENATAQQAIVDFIAAAHADLVLFAIGAPQSELLAWQVAKAGNCGGVGLCIGASIEFLTGEKRRAPKLWQRLRLEWAFRLLSEPRRLWRRYLVDGPRIFAIWWQWRGSRHPD